MKPAALAKLFDPRRYLRLRGSNKFWGAAAGALLIVTLASAPAQASPEPAAAAPAAAGSAAAEPAAAEPGAATYASCPAPKTDGVMQCLSVVRAHEATPMGVQPDAAPAGYSPGDLRAAYHLPATSPGPTVAIVDAFHNPNAETDLAVYRAQFGLAPCTTANGCLTQVDQRGGTQWAAYDPGWAGEISLDLQMVSAVCPNCHLLLVEADTNSDEDLYAAEDEAISLGARFVSNSWSGGEAPDQLQTGDPHFNHPGVVITASTGDEGFPGGYPSASQYVTAVGGTTLRRDASTPRGWTESAWRLAGSTCSPWEPAPAFQNQAMTQCDKRATADVSAVADPATGVAVYDGGWQVFGGTSVSAPIIAGVYALGGAPLTGSYPNALPYQHAKALNDVTTGNNGCGFVFCTAGPGWDGPTGLGTPNGVGAFSPGPRGQLSGTVTDRSGRRIADATVSAGGQHVMSDAQGRYALTLPPGHYTLEVSKFGYQERASGVDLSDGRTRTLNVTLTARPRATVSGTVRDGSGHGWPLYASVQVHGQPTTRTFTDPRTGAYAMSLPRHDTYDLDVAPVYQGYSPTTQSVAVVDTAVRHDVADPVEFASCDAPGYAYASTPKTTEPFDSTPEGWTTTTNRSLLWRFDDPGGRGNLTGGSGGFAIVDSDFANPSQFQDTSLVSPAWDLTGLAHPALEFHNDYFGAENSRVTVELSGDGGATWTRQWIHQTDSVRGPSTQTIDLTQWAGQPSVQVRFRYQGFAEWWWEIDDVSLVERSCAPQPGGLVVGQVTDKNTGSGLTGARVAGDGVDTTTVGTPDDPDLTEGRYATFTSAGTHALTASQPGGYVAVAHSVTVRPDGVASADFALPAGRVSVTPAALARTLTLGDKSTATLQIANTGTAPVTVDVNDVPGAVTAMAGLAGAATQHVSGTFRPGPASTSAAAARPAAVTPAAAPWLTAADYPLPVADNAMATNDGTVYSVAGVSSNGGLLSRVYSYDADAATWVRHADLHVARDYPQAAFLDGKLYVAGGWDGTDGAGVTDTMEVYDPAADTWTAGPAMPTGVAAGATAVLDNRMYVIGGCDGTNSCGLTTVQVYDPITNRWEPAAAYPQPTSFEGCGTITAKLYCAGGISGTQGESRDGYVYEPTTDRWTQIAGLPDGDQWAAAYSAADGRLLLVGGVIRHSGLLTNQGWAYDPTSNTWSPLPNANTPSWRSAGTCGFYKVGGAGLQPALVNTELLPGFGDCATAGNVSWLAATPGGARTLPPGGRMTVTVTLDAGAHGIDQPGSYTAGLSLSEDTPYPYATVPVTMTVIPPRSWGKLAGTITATSCAGNTVPLGGATVSVDGRRQSFTLRTDRDGRYQLWLDAANSPLAVTVGKSGWTPTGHSDVRLSKGRTTTVDLRLTPNPSC